ncbi:MAG: YvcK family protein [Candidatus Pacebacteria bacterium]|nr:YvcK family protein [Candidatus Paceibacterota bacterium]
MASTTAKASPKGRKKIIVIGGGTGTFTVLTGLKKYPVDLTAIVAMSDSGGSTGMLRDELGVLPPGDVVRCLIALSRQDVLMRALMEYRFEGGKLKGHRFGNLLLSALEKTTGSFDTAVEKASDILRTNGRVIPSTLNNVHLMAKVGSRTIRGEEKIQNSILNGSLKRLWLEPSARANKKAIDAIKEADLIVLGPGNLYASIVPNLLASGMSEAIRKSKATKVFICNLMTKIEHTEGWSVADYTAAIERYLGGPVDIVVYNNKTPDESILKKYAREGDTLTPWDELPEGRESFGANLMSRHSHVTNKIGTPSRESSLVRHDAGKLASILMRIVETKKKRT